MLLAAFLLLQSAPQCTAIDANLPAPLAAWATKGHGDPTDISKTVTLKTLIAADVPGLPANARAGGAASVGFQIGRSGTYAIVLDQSAWIDVVPDGAIKPLDSSAHRHGPQCSTIHKIVRFNLTPGSYRLYVSGISRPMVKAMLAAD